MARRSRGDGTVYREADGRWAGEVTVGWVAGKRQRRRVRGRTRAEVAAKLRAAVTAHEAGELVVGRTPTVEAWLAHWLDNIAAERVRPSTLAGYRQKSRDWLVPHLGRHPLDRLTPEHVERLYAAMREQGRAQATILQVHRILARALRVAEQRGKVNRNVTSLVDAPSVQRADPGTLTRHDARAVITAAAEGRNAARWSVALALGLRQGEALGLAWEAVDLEAGTLRVHQALQRQRRAGLHLVDVKSQASHRTITLPATLTAALRAHRAEQLRERLALGPGWLGWQYDGQPVDLVFAQRNGRPRDPRNDYEDWQQLLARAGVPRARLHDARHTAATLMLAQGVPARVVQDVLGHASVHLTLSTYAHVIPELRSDAAERVEAALWGDGPAGAASGR